MAGLVADALDTYVNIPSGGIATSVGFVPTGMKLVPGVDWSSSTTKPPVRSTIASSPRVVCVTAAKRWNGSVSGTTPAGTGAQLFWSTGSGPFAGSGTPSTRRHTTATLCAPWNVRMGTFVGVWLQLDADTPAATASAAIARPMVGSLRISSYEPFGGVGL